jgi:hypothetical protein
MARPFKSKPGESTSEAALPPRKLTRSKASSTGADGLESFPEIGSPPKARIKDADAARRIFTKFAEADETSAFNRALVRDSLEGAPPYDEGDRVDGGMDGLFNLNFHDLRALLEAAKTSYLDLVDSEQPLVRVKFPEAIDETGAATDRTEKEDIISEEFSQMVRDWPEFDTAYELLVTYLCRDGVAVAPHKDGKTWKFNVLGLDDAYFPRQTKVGEDNISIAFFREAMPVHELFDKLRKAKGLDVAVEKAGRWNAQEVRKELVEATQGKGRGKAFGRRWAELQDLMAGNDLGVSHAEAQDVGLIHALVREFDGQVSHYIFSENGNSKEFLYEHKNRYRSMANVFTVFTSNVGNGKLHSVRGQLYLAYPFAQTTNRLRCSMLDSTMLAMSTLLQPSEAEDIEDMAITIHGPVAWLPSEARAVEHRAFPNLAQNAFPVMRDLTTSMQNNLGAYQMRGVSPEGLERTRYEVQAQMETAGSLTASQVNRFYRDIAKLWASVFERIKAIGPEDPDHPEVTMFFIRCAIRGVSLEEVYFVEKVVPNKSVGSGGARQIAYQQAMDTMSALDPVGRQKLLFDLYAMRFGRDLALSYVGRPEKPRFVLDEKLAQLENASLKTDPSIVPTAGENHVIHARVHLGKVSEINTALIETIQSGQEPSDMKLFREALTHAEAILRHCGPHLEEAAVDPTRRDEFRELVKAFQNLQGQWEGVVRYLQKIEVSDEEQQEFMTRMQMKMQEHQIKMQTLVEEHQVRMQLKQQETQAKVAARRLETEMKVAGQLRQDVNQFTQSVGI